MNVEFFKELIHQTLFAPRVAAARLIGMKLAQEWLWMALLLMAILNTIVYMTSLHLSAAGTPEALAMIPPVFHSPILFALFMGGALVITVFALTWIGNSIQGTARIADILVLITWLQLLRLLLQIAIFTLLLLSSTLSSLAVVLSSLWGLVILACFLDIAHGFQNVLKALMIIALAVMAMIVGLSVLLGIIGVAVMGGA